MRVVGTRRQGGVPPTIATRFRLFESNPPPIMTKSKRSQPPSSARTRAASALHALLLVLLGIHAAIAADVLPLTAAQKKNLGIATAAATTPAAGPALTFTARVTLPPDSIRLVAASGAGLVTRLHVQAGDAVKTGAPLVTLSMPALVDAQHGLTQARLRSQLAASNLARDEKLFAEGLIAESRLRAAQSERDSAQADLKAAQAGLATGAPLVSLADLSKLGLEIPLSPAQSRQVAVGQSVSVAGSRASGRITALLPQLSASQSVLVRATLADPEGLLRPGQSVQAAIAGTRSSQAQTVPTAALVWKIDVPHVFVETGKGFVPTPVRVIRQNASEAEVVGVAPGSRVAVRGVAALKAQWLGE